MRAKNKVVSIALCALLLLVFGVTAQAQVVHNVTQQNNEVVQYGLTELMGEVTFTANALCAPCTTVASSITITYQGAQITNTSLAGPVFTGGDTLNHSAGLQLIVSGGYTTNFATSGGVTISAINTALGGQIILTIPGGFTINAGDQIRVNGARTDVSAKAVGASILALISSAPSNANTFNSVNVTVATVNSSMTVVVTGVTIPICTTPSNPTIRITEGFATAFVEYTSAGGVDRTRFGATGDTRVRIQVNSLPSGVTLSWPSTVSGTATSGATTGATLVLESGSTSSVAIYTYNTTDQGLSDTLQEYFDITPEATVPATSGFGQSTAQAQLWPDATSTTIIRFAHPLINNPADNFIAVNKCVTYLLFPFVTGNAFPGFTTGLAVANTSSDDAVFAGTTLSRTATAQAGAITLYGYQTTTKGADGSSSAVLAPPFVGTSPVSSVVSTNLAAGDSWSGVIDGPIATGGGGPGFAGFQGYVIARCDFQFGHGFSFIVGKYNAGTVFDVAHGYLALVIPDPSIAIRDAANGGETLGQ